MAVTNHERVGRALDLLRKGLLPYVEREMKAVYKDQWREMAGPGVSEEASSRKDWKEFWDVQRLLVVMWDHWSDVFGKTLGHAERSLVSELRETRKTWAHQGTFSSNDTHRALDTIARLLNAVSAHEEATEVEKMRMDLLRVQFEEQRRTEMRRSSFQPTEGKPKGGLKPWREVVTPHPDVQSGRYQQAEFAADLWQVYLNEAMAEYQNPTEFYRRTYLTEGLTQLLKKSIERMAGTGGDPVVELQTNFGGGKTHSMLALYHLFSGTPPTDLPGIEGLLKEVKTSLPDHVRRVVVVGTKISPGQPSKKPDGTVVHTLWGEIAWQLGGKEGYEMVRVDDERATNPGDRLKELFNRYSPCIILIDEWVAYARQLHEGSDLPGGTFDTQFTFAQALSESAKAAKQTMLIVSIPASDNEIGGEWGKKALNRLKNAVGRVETPWRPASADEGFEIVRRRLFEPLTNEQAIARDAVARAFVEMYGAQHQEFPTECREAAYERRIKMAYPIHPELFDRLYNDWSTLDKFQRTRGVLRLMAAVIHCLWERQDSNLLILPATIPIDDHIVQNSLTYYLDDHWIPVIEKDVDGPHSLPLILDGENSNLGRYSACRRVARTVYIGSAPTIRAANKGIDDRLIKLGCVQPGESVATFGDALRRLTDRATYLFQDGTRYWYSTQPTVNRLAEDRAVQQDKEKVLEEIRKRLQDSARKRGDFIKVHACVKSSDIPDEREVRLVILDPKFPYTPRNGTSNAKTQAQEILTNRGTSPRVFRNTLVFLAADTNRIGDLDSAVRQFLAWDSIDKQAEELNLDVFQKRQAETKRQAAVETVDARIPETYQWLLVPSQEDPKGEPRLDEVRLQGTDDLAVRASKKMKNDGSLLIQMGGGPLRHELDRIPLWQGDRISIRQLSEYFATYLYLPRIRDDTVLISAIRAGLNMLTWQSDSFAYAERYDDIKERYVGLHAGTGAGIEIDLNGYLVKPNVAVLQIDAEKRTSLTEIQGGYVDSSTVVGGVSEGETCTETETSTETEIFRQFYGSVKLNPLRVSRDAGKISDEVIQHFTKQLGSEVEVSLEIRAKLSKGADEKLRRDVTENCRTLKFDSCEFEK